MLATLAAGLRATPAQVALAWLLDLAPNILLIPGTSTRVHLKENLGAAGVELDDAARATLARHFPLPVSGEHKLGDMSRSGTARPAPAGGWLDGDQQRAWLAYIRVQLRLAYEMNRQLLADSGMSLPDYDVLTALGVADGERMQITVLAAQIGWERSRVSHHVRRMSARGLVTCGLSAADRRVTEVTLTGQGRQAMENAAPGHVELVRRLFFDGLPAELVGPLSEALESVYANIIEQGSLPPPVDLDPAED